MKHGWLICCPICCPWRADWVCRSLWRALMAPPFQATRAADFLLSSYHTKSAEAYPAAPPAPHLLTRSSRITDVCFAPAVRAPKYLLHLFAYSHGARRGHTLSCVSLTAAPVWPYPPIGSTKPIFVNTRLLRRTNRRLSLARRLPFCPSCWRSVLCETADEARARPIWYLPWPPYWLF